MEEDRGREVGRRVEQKSMAGETASSRDFIAGKVSGIEEYLPNIGMQHINMQLSSIFLAWAYWGWRFTAT